MVAVVGISASSRAQIDQQLRALGTNLLTVETGEPLFGEPAKLPPSDALAAQAVADETRITLLLALGGVALLVGGIGVANTMVIAVLERRS